MGPTPDISHLDRVIYLLGYPIKHSLAPPAHQASFDALNLKWEQILIESTDVDYFMSLIQDPKFLGSAVTMPHKVNIIPRLDELTAEGRDVGAINTIFLKKKDGKKIYCGTNTDCVGIREALLQNISEAEAEYMKGKPGMVIGGGGTCRAAVYALKKWLGCSSVYLVNRDKSEVDTVIDGCRNLEFGKNLIHVASEEQAQSLPGPAVIVSAVPNFTPVTDTEKMARGVIRTMVTKDHKGAILEMCYHPSPDTEISSLAQDAGWQVIPGTEAMIWQGIEQDILWTGRPVEDLPVQAVKDVVASKLKASPL